MKRILIALALLLPFSAIAQDRYDVPQTGTKVGLTRTGINSNFTFLFIAGTNAFRTAVEKGSNINFVAKSPTNATQLDYCLTNGSGSAGSPQSPLTNDLDAAGNSIENLDAPEITNTTIFIRLWGTNVLSLQGTTNVALNGVSLKDGPSDGNTPQGPWTNVVSLNGFAGTGGDYVQVTNQIAFRVGTNLLAVQGWPDATNIAWNGSALINPAGGGSGGYTAIPTNPHGFRVMYVFNSGTNFSTFEGTKLILMTNAANVVYDTGIADGFGRPYWNTTNSTWSSPKGKSRVTHFADAQQGAILIEGIGWNDSRTATNAFGANPAFEDKFAAWNILAAGTLYGGIRGPYSRIWESPGATNTYYIFARCASGCYNLYGSDLTVEIITVEP